MSRLIPTYIEQGLRIEQLERELAEAKKDAERYRWLRETLQSAKGGAYVTVNEHLSYYEKPEIGKEVKIQWYSITPIGFYMTRLKLTPPSTRQ